MAPLRFVDGDVEDVRAPRGEGAHAWRSSTYAAGAGSPAPGQPPVRRIRTVILRRPLRQVPPPPAPSAAPTPAGTAARRNTPQGSPISPLLANVALYVLDEAWQNEGRRLGTLVRYCDDFVVLSPTEQRAELARELAARVLEQFGMRLHPERRGLETGHHATGPVPDATEVPACRPSYPGDWCCRRTASDVRWLRAE